MNDQKRHNSRNHRNGHSNSDESINFKSEEINSNDERFIEHAKEIAKKLERGGKNQIRKFYDEFNIAVDSRNTFKLRMLLPKIHYQKSRKVLKGKMAQFLERFIEWTVKDQKFDRAKDFFTAVYGFYGEGK